MPNRVRVLFVGDIVGRPGRNAVQHFVPRLTKDLKLDVVIANAENAAGGIGLTPLISDELISDGVDVLTSGNHIWAKREIISYLQSSDKLLRPANYPPGLPGQGRTVFLTQTGVPVGIINLQGRVYMANVDCPFRIAEKEIERLTEQTNIILVDFHAEATSEKNALGWFLDGKVSAVLGTHTHVQTADERILPLGTGYISDVGMTGPMDSVIGMRKEIALERFLTQIPRKLEVAKKNVQLQGAVLEIDGDSGKCVSLNRIALSLESE